MWPWVHGLRMEGSEVELLKLTFQALEPCIRGGSGASCVVATG